MAKLSRYDFLREALDHVTSTLTLKCTGLTLLTNACAEAAQWQREHGSANNAEKYEAMYKKLYDLGLDLDKRINSRCDYLLEQAKKKKRGAR